MISVELRLLIPIEGAPAEDRNAVHAFLVNQYGYHASPQPSNPGPPPAALAKQKARVRRQGKLTRGQNRMSLDSPHRRVQLNGWFGLTRVCRDARLLTWQSAQPICG